MKKTGGVKMDFTQIKIETTQLGIELLPAALIEIGITGFEVQDPQEFREFLHSEEKSWDYIDDSLLQKENEVPAVVVYLPQNQQGNLWLEQIVNLLEVLKSDPFTDYGTLNLSNKDVKEQDWAHNWKAFFKPFTVGKQFLVKPTWETVANEENRKILEIDPGSSFGTGQHHTTKLCLEAMEQVELQDKRVLDMGCGSGILSIGSLLLGAREVIGVDIDLNSVTIAKENLEQNKLAAKFTGYCTDILQNNKLRNEFEQNPFDIVLANIVADVIMMQAQVLYESLKQNGTLITSGIIENRKEEVKTALLQVGFEVINETESKEWICFILKKK